MLSDFINFKIMIIPKLITILYVFLTVVALTFMFVGKFGDGQDQISIALHGMSPGVFWIIVVLIPFVFHIFFEYMMLPFAILDALRETRNVAAKQNDLLAAMQKKQE